MLEVIIDLFRDPSFWDKVSQVSLWVLLFSFLGFAVSIVRNRVLKRKYTVSGEQNKQRDREKDGIILSDERHLEKETKEEISEIVPEGKTPKILPSISVDEHEIDIPIQMHLNIKIGVGQVDNVSTKKSAETIIESTENRKLNIVGERHWEGKKK